MAHDVTFIPGDGTGPELTEATRRVLQATGVDFDWDRHEAGIEYRKHGNPFPEATLESLTTTGAGIKGPTTTPVGSGFRSIDVRRPRLLEGRAAPKANIMKLSDGLFLEVAREVAADYRPSDFADCITQAAVFEATHGSSPTYAGKNRMNPTAIMLSGVHMPDHLKEAAAARAMQRAIAEVIRKGEKVTYDLKPSRTDPTAAGTREFADAVIEEMNA